MANLGYLQIIRKCNQKCLFCSNPENDQVISFAKGKQYIDKFIKSGYQGVILTGGEPTLHPDLIKFIEYCKNKGIEPRIITNGQKTADFNFLKALKNNGLELMHVSVQSVKAKIQDFLSGNNGSLKNILKTLVNARKLKMIVNINTVINSLNANSLDRNIDFFTRKFPEIKHYIFNNLDPEMNRVVENPLLVPKFKDFKESLNRGLRILINNNKTFRVERVPLCFMVDFAEYSTETRKIVKNEERTILFLDNRRKNNLDRQQNFFYNKKPVQCQNCSLKNICAGIYSLKYYDVQAINPQTIDPKVIIDRIKHYE